MAAISQVADRIGRKAFDLFSSDYPEFVQRLNADGLEKCRQDVVYHTAYLLQAISLDRPIIFYDYVRWVLELFAALGISRESFVTSLHTIVTAIADELSPQSVQQAKHIVNEAVQKATPQQLSIPSLQAEEKQYMDFLLQGQRMEALHLVQELLAKDGDIRRIYTLFRNVLYQVGLLWQIGKINVAQEHYITAATQQVISHLYPHIFSQKSALPGKVVVGACATGELHEIGIRIVCDLLEMDGFDTHYLGANTPVRSLIDYAAGQAADAILLSVTLSVHLNNLQAMITSIKEDPRTKAVPVIVGGCPFYLDNNLYRAIGADYFATDAKAVSRILAGGN